MLWVFGEMVLLVFEKKYIGMSGSRLVFTPSIQSQYLRHKRRADAFFGLFMASVDRHLKKSLDRVRILVLESIHALDRFYFPLIILNNNTQMRVCHTILIYRLFFQCLELKSPLNMKATLSPIAASPAPPQKLSTSTTAPLVSAYHSTA